MKDTSSHYLSLYLQVNGASVVARIYNVQGVSGTYDKVSLAASLRLKANDTVSLWYGNGGVPHDSASHITHFIGWLVEEDL